MARNSLAYLRNELKVDIEDIKKNRHKNTIKNFDDLVKRAKKLKGQRK